MLCFYTAGDITVSEEVMAWLPGEQHQPLSTFWMALWQRSFRQSGQSHTLRQTLLFKHLLNILSDWRLKLG